MSALLIVVSGPDKGRRFPLDGPAQIGRGSGTLTKLTDAAVSRLHCTIDWHDGRAVLSNASDNGTAVNGERAERRPLRHGDLVAIGNTVLRYLDAELEESETVMQPAPGR